MILVSGLLTVFSQTLIHSGPMHYEVIKGNIEKIQQLLSQTHVDVDEKNVYGWTPLHCATLNNHDAITHLLLEHGANPTVQTTHPWKSKDITVPAGSTPSDIACLCGHPILVQILSEAATSFRASSVEKLLPILRQQLLKHQIDQNEASRLRESVEKLRKRIDQFDRPYCPVCRPDSPKKLEEQLAEHEKQFALHATLLASMREHPDFQHLHMHDTGSVPQAELISAAIDAFKRDNIRELSFLLEKGLDLNAQRDDNNNLFHLAALHEAYKSMKGILEWVCQKKVSAIHLLRATNSEGKTPIDLLDVDEIEALNIGTQLREYIKAERGKHRE